jgi:hypothetical protein
MVADDEEIELRSTTRPREVRRIEKTRMLDEARSEDPQADEDPAAAEEARYAQTRPTAELIAAAFMPPKLTPRAPSRRCCCACVTLTVVVVLLVLLIPLKMVYNGRLFWVFAARRSITFSRPCPAWRCSTLGLESWFWFGFGLAMSGVACAQHHCSCWRAGREHDVVPSLTRTRTRTLRYYIEQRPAMLAAARRCQLQWCWAQATPDISALELTSSVPGGYLSDALVVYAEQHGESAPLAVLQLGCCGSSGRAWQLWRSRQSK